MIRDEAHDVLRYSLALETDGQPGIKNLVLTLTPRKEVSAVIVSYVPDDPKQLFFGIQYFTGEMIVTDLEGNEMNRTYLVKGESPKVEGTHNGRMLGLEECSTSVSYVAVYTQAGTSYKQFSITTTCVPSGGNGGGGGGGGEQGGGSGGGVGGTGARIMVNRVLSTVSTNSQLPSNSSDGQTVYIKNKDGSLTELVYVKELDAWLMPELIFMHYDGRTRIESNRSFNGRVLGAAGALALMEPSPIGEVVWAAAATAYVAIYAIDLLRHPNVYNAPPNGRDLPWIPGVSPGDDWEWRGRTSNPEDGDGNWIRGERPNQESLNPDFDHPPPIPGHWDYTDPDGRKWRIFPDGSMEPK